MKWDKLIQKLAAEDPEAAKMALSLIKLRKAGKFSAEEAFEATFGTELSELLLSSEEDFDKMLQD